MKDRKFRLCIYFKVDAEECQSDSLLDESTVRLRRRVGIASDSLERILR